MSAPSRPAVAAEPEVCACARQSVPLRFHVSEAPAILREIDACVGKAGSMDLWRHRGCFPLELGVDTRNGEHVQARFVCAEECPSEANVALAYGSPRSIDECRAIGGVPESAGITLSFSRCLVDSSRAAGDCSK